MLPTESATSRAALVPASQSRQSRAPDAELAISYFVYQAVKFVGAYTAVLVGLDAMVFTAGIGENAASVPDAIVRQMGWLGVKLDEAANARNGPRISTEGSAVSVWVIPTNEELMIARHTLAIAKAQGALV
jgi:acetate kinase